MARALFGMAAVLAVVEVIAVTLGSNTTSLLEPIVAARVRIGHGVFVALFTASGLLFRHASLAKLK